MLPLIILTIIGVLILFLGFSGRTKLIVPIAILGILGALAAYFSGAKMYSEWMIGMMSLHGIYKRFQQEGIRRSGRFYGADFICIDRWHHDGFPS